MRVIHVTPKFSYAHWGGAEGSIVEICKRLPALGYECEVWTNKVFSRVRLEKVDDLTVRRFGSFFLGSSDRARAGSGKAGISLPLLLKILGPDRPDLLHIHCHNRLASLASVVGRARRVPILLTVHSRIQELKPRWRYRFANEAAIKMAAHVTVVDPNAIEDVVRLGVPSGSVTYIPNGVDLNSFARVDGEQTRHNLGIGDLPLIATIGRIDPVKNQSLVVGAFPRILERIPNAHLLLVGFPSNTNYYESILHALRGHDWSDRVHVIPGLPPNSGQLHDAYAAADVVVIPSLHEAFSVSLLEAWAAGRPVVASDVGGLRKIAHGQDGLLFAANDQADLASKIIDLLSNRQRAKDIGAVGRGRLKDFDWDQIAVMYARLYRELLK